MRASALAGRLAAPFGFVGSVLAGPVNTGASAASAVAARTGSEAHRLPGRIADAAATVADLGPQRTRRRVWARNGRAHIEVRGLTGPPAAVRRLTLDVTGALGGLKGVHWAEVNAVTGQVLVAFDEDDVDLGTLVRAVASVEEAHGQQAATFSWTDPAHPADDAPLVSAAVSLSADVAGMAAAATTRVLRISPLPRSIRAPFALASAHPRLRDAVIARFGPAGGDLLLTVGNAVAHGMSQGPSSLAVDAVARVLQLGELRSRRDVWARRELALHSTGHALPAHRNPSRPRPAPLPPGAAEKAAERISTASAIAAASVLVGTADPGRSADMLLATVPNAARLGREGFASTLGMELARRDVVPLDGSALRRLDRITAVVIDSAALCSPRPRILARPGYGNGTGDTRAWQQAECILGDHSLADLAGSGPWGQGWWRLERATAGRGSAQGPDGLTVHLVSAHGRVRDTFLVGPELARKAEAVLAAARDAADTVVLTEHPATAELAGWADEVVPAATPLARHVRQLQARGHGVLVISPGADDALASADVGLALTTPDLGVCWSADLVCGPGLGEAWRVLRAVAAARQASDRAARFALGGSGLGALLAATGQSPRSTRTGTVPVHSAALLAIGSGAGSARSVGREAEPAGTPRGPWHTMTAAGALSRLTAERAAAELEEPQPGSAQGSPRSARAGPRARRRPEARPAGDFAHSALDAVGRLVPATVLTPIGGAVELARAVQGELRDPLTPVLALGTMASAVVGSGVDATLVAGVMAGNALISGAQRLRAERALHRLLAREQPVARLVRWSPSPDGVPGGPAPSGSAQGATGRGPTRPDGGSFAGLAGAPEEKVLAADLRPGDIIALRPDDLVPADARLLTADDLEVDESMLTGESLPVPKSPQPTPGVPVAERACMVYEGCTVLAGTGYAVVAAVGAATEAGRAAAAAERAAPPAGIQARLAELTRISVPASGLGGLAVAGLGLLRGVALGEAVSSGVAVAVAAVPEGLPLVATVAQLGAARRLSGTGVLVRSSRALEALGRADIVCFDKTGTLTEGRLSVAQVAVIDGTVPLRSARARHVLRIAARACPQISAGTNRVLAHATDRVVVEAARDIAGSDASWRLAAELPFEASRGFSASLGENEDGTHLAVKGAPEVVLPRCTRVARPGGRGGGAPPAGPSAIAMTPATQRAADALLNDLAARGLRVLAVAEARLPDPPGSYRLSPDGNSRRTSRTDRTSENSRASAVGDPGPAPAGHGPAAGGPAGPQQANPQKGNSAATGRGDLVRELTLTGFLAIADTPRASAEQTVRRLGEAGVRVTMLTGDHPATAVAIAGKLGIPGADRVLTGAEISSLPEALRAQRIAEATVFARVSPEQKVRIVQALQRAGHVVAMAGDGVNDAAAIRLADVGVAVTTRGSRPARGAADLVLTDSDTLHIIDALLEGRALWGRVRDAVSILVGGNAGEVAFTLLGTTVTGRAPLGTRQLLLVNTLTDMLPALAVALAPTRRGGNGEGHLLTGGPVGPFPGPDLARAMTIRGSATAFGATVAWQAGRVTGRRRRASTMGLATLVLTQLGQTVASGGRSPLVIGTSAVSAAALAAVVETPGVSQFFGCTPLGPVAWAIATGSAAGATVASVAAPRLLGWQGG